MRQIQIRDAKATFSAVVEAAERGEPTTITRHGRPAAVVVPVEAAEKLYGASAAGFVDHLFAFPGMDASDPNEWPIRDIDL